MLNADDVAAPAGSEPWARGYDPVTPWGAWSGLAMTAVVLLIALIAVVAVTTVAMMVSGVVPTGDNNTGPVPPELASMSIWGMLAGQTAAVLSVLVFSTLRHGRPASVLALGAPPMGIKAFAIGLVAFLTVTMLAGFVINLIFPHDQLEDLKKLAPLVQSSIWPLTLLSITAGAALSEELLFRGFLFSALLRSPLGVNGTAVVTSALWTLLHAGYSGQGLFLVFCLGLAFSALLVRFGSLWVPIFCHAVYNALAFFYLKYVVDTSAVPAPAMVLPGLI